LFAQWVIYFDWKKKFAGLGGVKGGSHEYILQLCHGRSQKLHAFTEKELENVKAAQKLLGALTIGRWSAQAGGGGGGS
jgi:hypothetical protein